MQALTGICNLDDTDSPPTSPPPNGATARLTIIVSPVILSGCANPPIDCVGMVYAKLLFRDHSNPSNNFFETIKVNNPQSGSETIFQRDVLIGGTYDILFGKEGPHNFYFANIVSSECIGEDDRGGSRANCEGTKGPQEEHIDAWITFLAHK